MAADEMTEAELDVEMGCTPWHCILDTFVVGIPPLLVVFVVESCLVCRAALHWWTEPDEEFEKSLLQFSCLSPPSIPLG